VEKGFVKFAACKAGVENLGVDASSDGAEMLLVKKANSIHGYRVSRWERGRSCRCGRDFFRDRRAGLQPSVAERYFGDTVFLRPARLSRKKSRPHRHDRPLSIWKRDTRELIRFFHQQHFRAIAACIDTKVSTPALQAANLTNPFPRSSANVDACGENGEFHTFVFDGPIFRSPIPIRTGEVVNRDGFIFCDLLPPNIPLATQTKCHSSGGPPPLRPAVVESALPKELPKHPTRRNPKMFSETQKENLLLSHLLALALIWLAAALRIARIPGTSRPWALWPSLRALLKNRRLAFFFPLLALFLGDVFIGFHKLIPIVYASFLVNVAIGLWLRDRRSITASLSPRSSAPSSFSSHQLRRLATPRQLSPYYFRPPRLLTPRPSLFLEHACRRRRLRLSFFGGYALTERLFPVFREPVRTSS